MGAGAVWFGGTQDDRYVFRPLFVVGEFGLPETAGQPTTACWAGSRSFFDRPAVGVPGSRTSLDGAASRTRPDGGRRHIADLIRSDGRWFMRGDRSGAITFVPRGGGTTSVPIATSTLPIRRCGSNPGLSLPPAITSGFASPDKQERQCDQRAVAIVEQRDIQRPYPRLGLYEHLIALVTLRIRGFADEPVTGFPRHGSLGSRVASTVRDYIDATLGRRHFLGDLADVAGVAVGFFCASLPKSRPASRLTPYVLEERIRRSEMLLCETGTTLSAIALSWRFLEPEPLHHDIQAPARFTPPPIGRNYSGILITPPIS